MNLSKKKKLCWIYIAKIKNKTKSIQNEIKMMLGLEVYDKTRLRSTKDDVIKSKNEKKTKTAAKIRNKTKSIQNDR